MASGQDHYSSAEQAIENARSADSVDDQTFFLLAAIAEAILASANSSGIYQ